MSKQNRVNGDMFSIIHVKEKSKDCIKYGSLMDNGKNERKW